MPLLSEEDLNTLGTEEYAMQKIYLGLRGEVFWNIKLVAGYFIY